MQPRKTKIKKESSFTLLELLIVIAIIAILAAIVLVALDNAKQSANESRGLQFSQNIKSTLATDLVGEWTFDDQTNPEMESSGNNILCTISGSQWEAQGRVRGARKFLGRNDVDYLNCNNVPILNFGTSDFSIEFWMRKDSGGKIYPGIISKNASSSGFRVTYRGETSKNVGLGIIVGGAWINYFPTKLNISENKWQHITITANRSSVVKFYVNGEFKDELDMSGTKDFSINNVNPLRIGDDTFCRADYCGAFDGVLDEVRIYKRALTAYEIKALYAEGKMRHIAKK